MCSKLAIDLNMITGKDNFSGESTVKDYFQLLKPRVMSLVIFTSCIGMYMAPGTIHPFIAFISILCISIGSGASGAINMWYDRDIDLIMERTKNRPLVRGVVDPQDCLFFGSIFALFSCIIMGLFVNILSAFLLGFAILFYIFIYTIWLKRSTVQNIVIGGVAGSLPPIIGWTSVTGRIELLPFLMFLIIFFWTPSHFWALSLYRSEDYQKAGVPMMPVVKGHLETKKQIILYSLILFVVSLLPSVLCNQGMVYTFFVLCLNIRYVFYSIKVYEDEKNKIAPKMFIYSIIYLFLLFIFFAIDKMIYIPLNISLFG